MLPLSPGRCRKVAAFLAFIGAVRRRGIMWEAKMQRWQQRPEGSNWGDFGADDQHGTLNFITREVRLAAAAEIREGLAFLLSMPLDYPRGSVVTESRHPPRLGKTFLYDEGMTK